MTAQPTKEREAELIAEWHSTLLWLIEAWEAANEEVAEKERAALGMLAYVASLRSRAR